jgi:hypothetical protein
MTGGLLNLVSQGQMNVLLNMDPSKTFWKCAYKKYTNFGLQKFRLDYEGSQTLSMTTDSVFTFKVDRNADLLVDSFLSLQLPTIWSPIYPPQEVILSDDTSYWTDWAPYDFRWIKNVGAQIIRQVELCIGGQTVQRYSGAYLLSAARRDFNGTKRQLFNEMIGQIPELIDPANANGRSGQYPSAFYTSNPAGANPSIPAYTLNIPLNAFYGLDTQQAFPLVALQYNILTIKVTLRPVRDWFQIRDVTNYADGFPYVQPNFNNALMQMYRFLQTPPDVAVNSASYIDTRTLWNANIHLMNTYAFLSSDEREVFAKSELIYPIRAVREMVFYDVTGEKTVQLNSTGMVSGWMFYFQRSDVNLRNEWSNYTNWEFEDVQPVNVVVAPESGSWQVVDPSGNVVTIGPGINQDGVPTGLYVNQDYSPENIKRILVELGILFGGENREEMLPYDVYNYLEKYTRTGGGALTNGLLVYNFCLNTSTAAMNPNGAQSMSPYNRIELRFETITPPLDVNAQTLTVCNEGEVIGINKPTWNIYKYNYNLVVFEETFNRLIFNGGNAALEYQYA